MDAIVTYQQDTVVVKKLLKAIPSIQTAKELKINRTLPPAINVVERRDTSPVATQKTTAPPTAAQIRYWRWQREQKILVDNSRYIQPKTNVSLVATNSNNSGIGLPMRKNEKLNTDWLTILLIIVLVLLATVRNTFSKYLGNLFHSLINFSTAVRMFGEKNNSVLHGAFRLEVNFYIVFSIFLFQLLNFFHLPLAQKSLLFFALVFAYVLIYFLLKKAIYLILGSVFNSQVLTSEILFNTNNSLRVLGLILFPVVALIEFFPSERVDFIVVSGIIITSILYALSLYRGALILLKKQFSIYYLFLYLCTLEFLPLLLIYKVVVE